MAKGSFSRPVTMKKYLNDITSTITDFDSYYLFCMYGIALNDKKELKGGTGFIREFTTEFSEYREVIAITILLSSMINEGFDPKEKDELKMFFTKVLTKGNSSNPLSNNGISKMDAFANKGFEEYKKKYKECQKTIDSFLITIFEEIRKTIEKGKVYPKKV